MPSLKTILAGVGIATLGTIAYKGYNTFGKKDFDKLQKQMEKMKADNSKQLNGLLICSLILNFILALILVINYYYPSLLCIKVFNYCRKNNKDKEDEYKKEATQEEDTKEVAIDEAS